MSIPDKFLALSTHPAPGLHFSVGEESGANGHVIPAPHAFEEPATEEQLAWLKERTAEVPELQQDLLEFYRRWNGAALCCATDGVISEQGGLLQILPIDCWEEYTKELEDVDSAWMIEGLEEMYVPGKFFVIAITPTEGTRLVTFLGGKYNEMDPTGKIFYMSMDPVFDFVEPVALSFADMLEKFASDPAEFLAKIGSEFMVKDDDCYCGDVPDKYLADCRS